MTAQPTPFADAQLALKAKLAARAELRRQFTDLRQQAFRLLQEAEKVAAGLSDIEVQQVRAAGKLAGAYFYSMPAQADAVDFKRLREDLDHVARSIDPLIFAIGEEARCSSLGADAREFAECFKDVIANAIDGNGSVLLDTCAENAQHAIDSPTLAAQHAREFQQAE